MSTFGARANSPALGGGGGGAPYAAGAMVSGLFLSSVFEKMCLYALDLFTHGRESL